MPCLPDRLGHPIHHAGGVTAVTNLLMATPLKLQQGQIWQLGDQFIRIVRLERLAVEYKLTTGTVIKASSNLKATKKEFCRLIKTAVLQPAAPAAIPSPVRPG